MIDFTTPVGQRAAERLADEQIVWLATVDADGMPQPAPVWFVWDGAMLLCYSQPKARRLKNIAQRPNVALHFNTDPAADEVIVLTGQARLDPAAPPADQVTAYREKYAGAIAALGWTPASFAADYSVAFRITPVKLRGSLG